MNAWFGLESTHAWPFSATWNPRFNPGCTLPNSSRSRKEFLRYKGSAKYVFAILASDSENCLRTLTSRRRNPRPTHTTALLLFGQKNALHKFPSPKPKGSMSDGEADRDLSTNAPSQLAATRHDRRISDITNAPTC